MNIFRGMAISSITLTLLGAGLLVNPRQAASPEDIVSFPLYPLEVKASETVENVVREALPAQLRIPSITLDVGVKPATVRENDWEFFTDAVSFWDGSARPGEGGNVILYAHRDKHFQRLEEAAIGEQAVIETENRRYTYTITKFRVVSPDQMEAFAPTDSEQLTLLTCTNENDDDRLVVIARPASSFGSLL